MNTTAAMPVIDTRAARELGQETLSTKATPQIAVNLQPKTISGIPTLRVRMNMCNTELILIDFDNEPNFKNFQDAL
jgi:hypothetical protein